MALASLTIQAKANSDMVNLSIDAKNLADWITESGNNQDLPFIIIDKREANVFIFHSDGQLYQTSPALIGATIGDDVVTGVGQKKLSDITVDEKTTPAGRFEVQLGTSPNKSELLWIDYESGLSMHPVVTSNPLEQRLKRLLSSNLSDRRITYGCVNVSSLFYQEVIHPTFKNSSGITYILPEVHSIKAVFGAEADQFSHRE
jgi:hypothetical protein